jgi:hypothetical protein
VFGQTEEDHQIITSYAITQAMQRILLELPVVDWWIGSEKTRTAQQLK